MIKYFIISLGIISLALDISLYVWIKKTLPGSKIARRAYLAHFIIIDSVIAAALLMYGNGSQAYMQILMWVVCIFFITIVPKIVYSIFSLIDYPASWILGKRIKVCSIIGAVVAGAIFIAMLWGATIGRSSIQTRNINIESKRIPSSFNGYRIAFVSDIHLGNIHKNNRLIKKMASIINSENVDLVVNGGDLVNIDARELNEEAAKILGSIRSTDGTFSVFGNHDLGFYIGDTMAITPSQSVEMLRHKQAAMGWKMLVNEAEYIVRGGDSITISGVNYPLKGRHNGRDSGLGGCDIDATLNGINDSTYNILISHTPELWEESLSKAPVDLMLSGHVHAMQLKLSLGEWKWSPAKWLYERWSGLYTEQQRNLYINDGMGYVMYPMRIGTRPEITIITLKSTPNL